MSWLKNLMLFETQNQNVNNISSTSQRLSRAGVRAGNLRGLRDHNRGLGHQPTEGTRRGCRNLRRHPDGRKDAAQVNRN